jgi:hypothetical protein
MDRDSGEQLIRVWIPCFLECLLKGSHLPGIEDHHSLAAANLLSRLGTCKRNSGEGWERVVLCALFFRVLGSLLGSELGEMALFPPVPQLFRLEIVYYEKDFPTFLKEFSNPCEGAIPLISLCYPLESGFQQYDMFVVIRDATRATKMWGYQCKASSLPGGSPHQDITSIVLRSHDMNATSSSQAVQAGWIVASQAQRNLLLGPTFSLLRLVEVEQGAPREGTTGEEGCAGET